MLNRGERRRRNKVIYNRRAKLYFRMHCDLIVCTPEEKPIHERNYTMNHKYWKRAENYRELQRKSPSMHLYKNTGTIWDHGYWSKYERRKMNKQSRAFAKLELKKESF